MELPGGTCICNVMNELKKRDINIMDGSLWDKILRFALPLALTGILQQLFNAADIAVVGNFTGDQGEAAMAAVGANSPLIGLILNFFIGISLGSNVVIANAVGSGDGKSIRKAVHTSVVFALLAGAAIGIIGEFIAVPVLSAQNVPEEVLPYAVLYFRVYMIGMPVILLYNFESAVFRGVGNTRTPLIALIVSGLLNVVLNVVFVVAFHRTVDGVAAATVISNAVSCGILFYDLENSHTDAKIFVKELRIDRTVLRRILRIGIPAGIQTAVFAFANIIIQAAINSLGTIVMAASSAAYNIELFSYYVLNSFSQACTTFTGQNYGAGKIERCKKTIALCFLEGIAAEAIMISLLALLGRNLLSFFNRNSEVIEIGYVRLIVIVGAHVFSLCYEIMSGYMRGFGISVAPAILTIIGICGVRITWVYTVFARQHTFQSIILAYPVSLAATAVLTLLLLIKTRPSVTHAKKS